MAASKKSTVLGLCLWEGTDKPFSQATTGCTKQYVGIAAGGQNSLGVTLSTAQVTVRQTQTAPTDGSGMASLNESGVTYAVLAFR